MQNPLLEDLDEDDEDGPNEGDSAKFHFVRDYETVKIDMDVPDEFLLVLDDGSGATGSGGGAKGAFYKNIERKYVLRKKRQNVSFALLIRGLPTALY